MTLTALLVLLFLFVKHFVADFLYQPPYQWQNKGTFGHPGGIIHSLQHVFLTFFILLIAGIPALTIWGIVVLEFVVHYLTDWAKMNINAKKGWKCNTHNEFWILTGLDQLVHALTYIGIMAILFL